MLANSLAETSESRDHRETLVQQARSLSSGTLSYLCGSTSYSEVDRVQAEFVEFCEENCNRYRAWPPAWNDYAKIKGYKEQA